MLVVQRVDCEKSNVWGHIQHSVSHHPTGLSVLLRNPHADLPASVRTDIFLDVCLLWTLRLAEMEIATHGLLAKLLPWWLEKRRVSSHRNYCYSKIFVMPFSPR